MYIETRFYDNGKAQAKLHKGLLYPNIVQNPDKFDTYVESINAHPGEKVRMSQCLNGEIVNDPKGYGYGSIEDWLEEMCIEIDDVVPLLLALGAGKWVDITRYV